MPAFGNIQLSDGASTPVVHTFSPVSLLGSDAKYADRSSGVNIGFPTLTIQTNPPSKTSRLYKTRYKLVMPVLEVISGTTIGGITPPPSKAFDLTADVTFFAPERSSQQNRKDLLYMFRDLIDEAITQTLVVDQEAIY